MADQQFCLRWNNHQSTLISVFDTLLENGTLVDCTLAAEGQYLKAHKVVLSACSPYLETLLSQHYEKHPIVILKDVKFTELKSMMDYMYRGEVNISQDQLGTFLKAAESLQIKGLSDNGADGDARDVGSTPKAPPPRKASQPAPSSRPEPVRPESPMTDGSMSPSSRKRRRVRRSSQEDGDSHVDSNSCDLPSQAQSTPVPNIPAATSSITTTPIVKPAIVKPEQTDVNRIDSNSLPPESLKKEIEPISEPLLEPKTEYLEDVNNEDSVEDLTLDDDDDMEGMDISNMSNMSNMSRPGPSHGNDISNQGFAPWQLGANQSGTDEVFMAAQEAVNQHRDSQGLDSDCGMKISSVTSLQGQLEASDLMPILLPDDTASLDSKPSSIFGQIENSIPESLGDDTLDQEANKFESVFVFLPMEPYENEGTRESPLCRGENKSKGDVPAASIDNVCPGHYSVDGPPVKLVSVDRIIEGRKKVGRPKIFKPCSYTEYINNCKMTFKSKNNRGSKNPKIVKKGKRGWPRGKPRFIFENVKNSNPAETKESELKENEPEEIESVEIQAEEINPVESQTDQVKPVEIQTEEIKPEEVSSVPKKKRGRPFKRPVIPKDEKEEEVGNKKRPFRTKTQPKKLILLPDQRPFSQKKAQLAHRRLVSKKKSKEENYTLAGLKNQVSSHVEMKDLTNEESTAIEISNADLSSSMTRQKDGKEISRHRKAGGESLENKMSSVDLPASTTEPKYKNPGGRKRKAGQSIPPGKGVFKCQQCGRTYCYLRGLRQHIKLECNVPPQFPCPFCPQRCRYRQVIRKHVKEAHPLAYPKWYALHFIKPVIKQYSSKEGACASTKTQSK